MRVVRIVPIICLGLMGCSNHTEKKWASRATGVSPYSATLIEESYNNGESNSYRVRLDTARRNDDGWFFVEDLDTDLIISPKPVLQWTSTNDLLVTVHTAEIEGQTQRRFGGDGRPVGSLIVRYLADQPKQ